MEFMQSKNDMTINDPATATLGMHLFCDSLNSTFDISQPRFLDKFEANYSLETPDFLYPTSPMSYIKY